MRAVGRQAETNKFSFSFGAVSAAVSAAGGASAGPRAATGGGRSPGPQRAPHPPRRRARPRCRRRPPRKGGRGDRPGPGPGRPSRLSPPPPSAGARWGAGAGAAPSLPPLTAMEPARDRAALRGPPLRRGGEVPGGCCLSGAPGYGAARCPGSAGNLQCTAGRCGRCSPPCAAAERHGVCVGGGWRAARGAPRDGGSPAHPPSSGYSKVAS